MYSCAIWPQDLGGVRGDLTKGPFVGDLEAAQLYKVHHVLRKARLRPGDRLLEFGTGWGTAAIEVIDLILVPWTALIRFTTLGCKAWMPRGYAHFVYRTKERGGREDTEGGFGVPYQCPPSRLPQPSSEF